MLNWGAAISCVGSEKKNNIMAITEGPFSDLRAKCSSLERCRQSLECLGWLLAERKLELRVAEH